jgi:hypothetical protein
MMKRGPIAMAAVAALLVTLFGGSVAASALDSGVSLASIYVYDASLVPPAAAAATTPRADTRIGAFRIYDGSREVSPSRMRVSGAVSAAKGAERTLGPRFAPGKWLPHFEKHAGEFGYKNSVEYLKGVRDLVGREGVETFTRANGDRLFYDAARNEFAAMRPDGVLRTYFRPKDGADYWRTQIGG